MRKLPRIIFNTWSGAFFNPGGGEVQLLETKRALGAKGYSIDLYNQWAPQRDFDILHQFSIQLGVNYVVNEYRRLEKKIALSTILWDLPEKNSFAYFQMRELFLKSDILLTNSDMESDKIALAFDIPREKFFKTRNSISDAFLTDGDPALFRQKYSIEGNFVLSVANIDRRKNTLALIKACEQLGISLVLIGAIRDQEYFQECQKTGAKFTYLGPITNQELLKAAYKACKVFALPSLCETPSIAALEAGSQGATIVITSEGSTKEYFDAHAIYVDPFDVMNIASGIGSALQKNTSSTLSRHIRVNYSWGNTADDIIYAYGKLF
jgi:glycosyltransferase involved in cell wall biosynthesis